MILEKLNKNIFYTAKFDDNEFAPKSLCGATKIITRTVQFGRSMTKWSGLILRIWEIRRRNAGAGFGIGHC
jgi:hypothetical protein